MSVLSLGGNMENEKKDSCELVPVDEVEAELIFEPNPSESALIGYGSRKICRTSIVNQPKESHLELFHTDHSMIKWKTDRGKRENDVRAVIDVIKKHGVISRYDISRRTGLNLNTVILTLGELNSMGFIVEGKLGRTYYYRIANL